MSNCLSWSTIFVHIYIFFLNETQLLSLIKNWSCSCREHSSQHKRNSMCFGIDILKIELIFDGSRIDFSKIKTNYEKMEIIKFWRSQMSYKDFSNWKYFRKVWFPVISCLASQKSYKIGLMWMCDYLEQN